jgi:hypothetical protein
MVARIQWSVFKKCLELIHFNQFAFGGLVFDNL